LRAVGLVLPSFPLCAVYPVCHENGFAPFAPSCAPFEREWATCRAPPRARALVAAGVRGARAATVGACGRLGAPTPVVTASGHQPFRAPQALAFNCRSHASHTAQRLARGPGSGEDEDYRPSAGLAQHRCMRMPRLHRHHASWVAAGDERPVHQQELRHNGRLKVARDTAHRSPDEPCPPTPFHPVRPVLAMRFHRHTACPLRTQPARRGEMQLCAQALALRPCGWFMPSCASESGCHCPGPSRRGRTIRVMPIHCASNIA
jgi:hypothetical protein